LMICLVVSTQYRHVTNRETESYDITVRALKMEGSPTFTRVMPMAVPSKCPVEFDQRCPES